MGNTTSTQRQEFLQRDSRRFSELVADRNRRDLDSETETNHDRDHSRDADPSRLRLGSSSLTRRNSNAYGTFRRQFSSHSVRLPTDTGNSLDSDRVVYEQEERPLVNMEDLGMRDAPITHIAALPSPRPPSRMSRLGSRFLPNTVARNLSLNGGQENIEEEHSHRSGFASRLSSRSTNRFSSLRNSFRQRSLLPTSSSFSRSRPHQRPQSPEAPYQFSINHSRPDILSTAPRGSWRRQARFSIRRHSLSIFPNMLSDRPMNGHRPIASIDDADHLIPPLSSVDHRLDFDESPHELNGTSVEARNILSPSPSTLSRPSNTSSGFRRFQSLRSRTSARLIRRSDQPQLSQVLHLAAAAIAAQLSGGTLSNLQPVAADGFDGNLNTFVQTLQEAATAHANGRSDNSGTLDREGNQGPVNFVRVFQFPNSDEASNDHRGASDSIPSEPRVGNQQTDIDRLANDGEETRDRTVTLVVVGVRSMPNQPSGTANGSTEDLGHGLDTLLNLPFLPPSNLLRGNTQGALLRRSDGRSRTSFRRRSLNNFDSFPMQYESQRHHRTRSTTSRPDSTLFGGANSNLPVVLSESPPGPVPPPSTPAEPGRSGATTPIRRPSSAGHPSVLPYLEEDPSSGSDPTSTGSSTSPYTGARQRRRSDSEFARRPELSSGATRRNGVVGPDETATSPGRSWLIYVVGTSVSPDHPAFTMPSLFTDNPSYEDMQLLSTLLGPVKPPVATQADIASAGGIFRLRRTNEGLLLATSSISPSSEPESGIVVSERCLICLCDFESDEELRMLNKCQHLYHRECIDEVSGSIVQLHLTLKIAKNECSGSPPDETPAPYAEPRE
ncbi:MAG: hypothetical protein Q9227_009476 [Pyrenula ochraceoflavens]